MNELRKIRRALISVSDKTGIDAFAKVLAGLGVEIISTGGTARSLRDSGVHVTDVSDVTGFPEMMDGRVKTLHPKIHGALLGLRDNVEHGAAMDEHDITPIDLIVVNLYPFEKTVEDTSVTLDRAVENIDIGGPAMIRSASKNWRDVAVVTDARLYPEIMDELHETGGSLSLETRARLAALAFTRTAAYDLAISSYLAGKLSNSDLERLEPFNPLGHLTFITSEDDAEPEGSATELSCQGAATRFPDADDIYIRKIRDLRYGENPHQNAALYTDDGFGVAVAEQLHGKEMSFNNYVDADAAWAMVNDLDELAVAIIKHTNPSGVGTGSTNEEAYRRALATDPVSAFGGIVAFNRPVDAESARSVSEIFTEVVIAPGYDPDAIEILRSKKNLRVLQIADASKTEDQNSTIAYRQISGGFLAQDADDHRLDLNELKVVTERKPSDEQLAAMQFAWIVCKHVKSNAIVLANEYRTLGVGAGQMNRVDSIRIAAMRAERFDLPLKGCILASDAFFPFRDNVDEAAKLGVAAIIQPGGSIKDDESIAAANEHGIAMAFTGIRHFRH